MTTVEKVCSESLVISEIQDETTLRHYNSPYRPTRMAKIKKNDQTKC